MDPTMFSRARILLCSAFLVSCAADIDRDQIDRTEQPVKCSPKLAYYPVRGKHNNGYDKTAGNSSLWSCGNANSNTDFVKGDHLGNDIWAAEGTPVVATTNGTYTLVGSSSYSGNKVTIIDDCGWYHFYCHLQKLGPGVSSASNGKRVTAGTVIGYVGKTGTASNGVVHLHYSTYPDGNYNSGVDPYPYLKVVESDVCTIPGMAPACTPTKEVCDGKDNDCDGKIDEDGVCAVTPVEGIPPEEPIDVAPIAEADPPNSDAPDEDDPMKGSLEANGGCNYAPTTTSSAAWLLLVFAAVIRFGNGRGRLSN
jgi:hypothetical protein